MLRETQLKSTQDEKKSDASIQDIIEVDLDIIKRGKQTQENLMTDHKRTLKKRLSEHKEIDKAVIESTYFQLKQAEAMLKLYSDFEEEYYKDLSVTKPADN